MVGAIGGGVISGGVISATHNVYGFCAIRSIRKQIQIETLLDTQRKEKRFCVNIGAFKTKSNSG